MHAVSGKAAAAAVILVFLAGASYLFIYPPAFMATPTPLYTYTVNGSSISLSTNTTSAFTPADAVQVYIPYGGGENDDGATNFLPQVISVVIGVNNTVTWIESGPHRSQHSQQHWCVRFGRPIFRTSLYLHVHPGRDIPVLLLVPSHEWCGHRQESIGLSEPMRGRIGTPWAPEGFEPGSGRSQRTPLFREVSPEAGGAIGIYEA